MKVIFWLAAAFVFYTYVGYPIWLWICGQLNPQPVQRGSDQPLVSVVMVVRNEERNLSRKLQNLLELNYPSERIEFLVASDGSTDKTAENLSDTASDKRFRVLISSEPKGKAYWLSRLLTQARGEIAVFLDARQEIEPGAVRFLVENFADTTVGCVSGELMLGDRTSGETEKGMGIYWRLEKIIRELESASGSVVGATGALYAARVPLMSPTSPIPPETILDDVLLPLQVARQGKRVIFDGRARAWDVPDLGGKREFARKVRTLTGNYQLLQIAPWVLSSENPLRMRFIGHKLLRLFVPFGLVLLLVASASISQSWYRVVFVLQLAFYALGLLALFKRQNSTLNRVANVALTFIVLNSAAVVAFANFVTRRKEVWVR
jgi:poly-beta-1,6-N-acetyl-D-glucosamine synthase